MKPIPTPEEIQSRMISKNCWTVRQAIKFTHDTILAALGYERCGDGWGITITQPPEPWGEGHRLLVPGKDTWREGDEFFPSWDHKWQAIQPALYGCVVDDSIGRRPLRNPWRRIKDAPPEHMKLDCLCTGGRSRDNITQLENAYSDRTHYMLLSDLPPVPSETPRDLEREKFEAWLDSEGKHTATAWEAWQAARKEKP